MKSCKILSGLKRQHYIFKDNFGRAHNIIEIKLVIKYIILTTNSV